MGRDISPLEWKNEETDMLDERISKSIYIYIETHFEYTIRGKPTTVVSKVFTIEDRSNLQIFQPPNLYGSHTLLIRLARRENGEDLHIIYHVPSFLHESLSLSLLCLFLFGGRLTWPNFQSLDFIFLFQRSCKILQFFSSSLSILDIELSILKDDARFLLSLTCLLNSKNRFQG